MMLPILAEAAAHGGDILDTTRQIKETFGVAWQPFLSNLISFLLVCWLLQRFAYQPILKVLAERRERIAESLRNVEQIKAQLAEAETRHAEILAKANDEARAMIAEARASADALAQTRQQTAIAEAEGILTQAREAVTLERDRVFADLKREVARLVVETTGKVAGKELTAADQQRLGREASLEIANSR